MRTGNQGVRRRSWEEETLPVKFVNNDGSLVTLTVREVKYTPMGAHVVVAQDANFAKGYGIGSSLAWQETSTTTLDLLLRPDGLHMTLKFEGVRKTAVTVTGDTTITKEQKEVTMKGVLKK